MLLLPLALSACTQPEAPEPTPQAVTQESVATSQATTAQPTTSVETKEATTVQPADNAQAQTLFAQDRVMLPSQGNPELVIQDVRAGTHADVDRVVFEYSGTGLPGVIAAYNPDPRQQASGLPMEVPGNAFLEIMIQGTPMAMMSPREDLIAGGPVGVGAGHVVDVVHGGVFEADTQYIIGLDQQLPFHVYVLENPTRVVVDFQRS